MLQYKSNEKTREKMKLLLKARNQEGQLGEPTKLIMRTKRKLRVYRRDGKFYIDHSAAYALGLTNVRSIMTEKAHLIEIGIETLHRFQSNKDIEIIYQELDKEQKSKTKQSNLEDTLGKLEDRIETAESDIDGAQADITEIKAYTVNGKAINTNPVLNGGDIALTGYTPVDGGTVAAGDTINAAINKLESTLVWYEA